MSRTRKRKKNMYLRAIKESRRFLFLIIQRGAVDTTAMKENEKCTYKRLPDKTKIIVQKSLYRQCVITETRIIMYYGRRCACGHNLVSFVAESIKD